MAGCIVGSREHICKGLASHSDTTLTASILHSLLYALRYTWLMDCSTCHCTRTIAMTALHKLFATCTNTYMYMYVHVHIICCPCLLIIQWSYGNWNQAGYTCIRAVCQTSYAYSLLMRANKLKTAAVQGSLACLTPP